MNMDKLDWEKVRDATAHLRGKVVTVELPHEEPVHAVPMLMLPTPWPAGVSESPGFQAGLIPAPEGMRPLEDPHALTDILKRLAEL